MSKLEDSLAWGLKHLAPELGGWEREYRAIPGRKFRADFAFPASRLAIECQGGIFMRRGAHAGPTAAKRDMEKLNLYTIHGWRLLQFGPHDLTQRAVGDAIDVIKAALIAPR